MTRIPDHGWKEAVRVLEEHGFRFLRQEGSHTAYWKPGISRPVVVPKYNSLPNFIISNILKTAKISRKDYVAALCGGTRKHGKRLVH